MKVYRFNDEKFTQIGAGIAAVAKTPKDLRQDLVIFFLTHAEDFYDSTGARKTKAKTIGKMIDEKLTLEGLFSIVLYGKVKKDKDNNLRYVFETKNSGDNTCKAPLEMFESDEIPNDLELVRKSIINF
jgi:acid phosphatase class B